MTTPEFRREIGVGWGGGRAAEQGGVLRDYLVITAKQAYSSFFMNGVLLPCRMEESWSTDGRAILFAIFFSSTSSTWNCLCKTARQYSAYVPYTL